MSEDPLAPPTPAPPRFRVRIAQRSDVGKVRSENQDFAIVADEAELQSRGSLLIVADGMGGHRGGATASRVASTTIRDQFLASSAPDPAVALRAAVEEANHAIFTESQTNPNVRGMGTTCSTVLVHEDRAWFAHVGDSRIYLVRDGEIQQLTEDHSLVASMVREGLLTRAEAEVHPRRNVLQRSLGVSETVEVDVSAPLELQAGDTFILCSDGLHGLVKEPELREVAALPIQQAVSEFIRRAIERGAPDNVTVIVARIEDRSIPIEEDSAPATEEFPTPPTPANAQTEKINPAVIAEQAAEKSGFLKWLLVALLVCGALGASFYVWSSQSRPSGAAPRSR